MTKERVVINDVGPRDGLQNQANILDVAQRLQLIKALVAAGLPAIEVGAFVSPKAVPAMAGTGDIVAALPDAPINYSALIPNLKGYQLAKAAGVKTVGLVVAASNTMNEKNIRMTTAQALDACLAVIACSKEDGIKTNAYVATAWACPFEGDIAPDKVEEICAVLLDAGAEQVVIADTIGAADPAGVTTLMQRLIKAFGAERIACHFHDTRGMGLVNVYAALQEGIRYFDASIAGLGGCPFAPGASGNVATEDVVVMLNQMGFETGIDLNALLAAAELADEFCGPGQGGGSYNWLRNQRSKNAL